MPPTISYEFGDIVLVPFPFTDQTARKQRPAVVVSSPVYNRERRDLILLAITSQIRSPPFPGEAAIAQWRDAGLLKPSVLKPVITTVETGLVRRKLGRLEQSDLQELRRILSVILG
ncbi:MAG: type II toxin-antitoxin system PemK/MazF family toxin [bacterium]|nr:type II toxin-antitoxin system PemK/MazF family toxin [bacterium]